jgi:single-stranded-DNA-specific exonuclease
MEWRLRNDQQPKNLEELEQVLLTNRGITDLDVFFHPPHPQDIALEDVNISVDQVQLAVRRVAQALKDQEEVVVFGDYDADGVSSTTIMWETLHHLGCKVKPFIPHREKHGYGMTDRSLNDLLATSQPKLLITVDNGIVAHPAVERLNQAGIDVIITDHHQPEDTLPAALAIVHTTQLCGATVAWMFAREVAQQLGDGFSHTEFLDICAIATVADQVPLLNANRSFAFHGIRALRETERVGLKALFGQAQLKQSELTTTSINFGIAPRINAMGRLDHSLEALRLLCTTNLDRAHQLTQKLADTNSRRQDLTWEMVDHAKAQANDWKDEHVIVIASESYHDGVIGLIAGKLMEEYAKPAIVMSISEKVVKASARSVAGVNVVELIRQVRSDLLEVGGHPMAAGFSLEPSKVEVVAQRLRELAKAQIKPEQLKPALDVECVVAFELISNELVELQKKFEPFGQANPEPVLGLHNMQVMDAFAMGREGRHLKLVVAPTEKGAKSRLPKLLNCLAWNKGELAQKLLPGTVVQLAGVVEVNEWNGKKSIQLKIMSLLAI